MPFVTFDNGPLPDVRVYGRDLASSQGFQQGVLSGSMQPVAVVGTSGQSRFAISNTTVLLSTKLPGGGEEWAMIEVQGADILWWDDTKDPAVTPGHLLQAGSYFRLDVLATAKFVRATSTDATLVVSYYKNPVT